MPRFRAPDDTPAPADVPALLADALRPAHFYLGPGLHLVWEHVPREEIPWEIFRGRLLDPAHTRRRESFASWNAHQVTDGERPAEPLLSVKLAEDGTIHVVRGLDSYVWEGYEGQQPGVYLSRERRRWVRELVGSIAPGRFADMEELRDELIALLFHAVVGTSRLPLTSVEAPLPAFSFGDLFYSYLRGVDEPEPAVGVDGLVSRMLTPAQSWREKAKWLETFLHATPADNLPEATARFLARWEGIGHTPGEVLALLRTLFNEVSLSPYTGLGEKTLSFLGVLEERGACSPAEGVDFVAHLLRQLGRHLSAYDLVTFHHRGANYPDALLLDDLLAGYLARIEDHPDLFTGDQSLRRRALRQEWLLRRRYEGHPVPDLPTSPGENSRVMPATHPRVPEEQILQPTRRQRKLYEGDPLSGRIGPRAEEILRLAVRDLDDPRERRELGTALFLDRPLGAGKERAEPDATPLIASVAYSAALARRRLRALAGEFGPVPDELPEVPGLPAEEIDGAARPGVVSLTGARQAGPDFVFLHTTRSGVEALFSLFDFSPLGLTGRERWLIAPTDAGRVLRLFDETFTLRHTLRPDLSEGYASRACVEYPAAGLRVERDGERGLLRLIPHV